MNASKLVQIGFVALIAALPVTSALAQQPASEPSMGCRLFPLGCPGPTPPMPQPLYGAPDEQAEAVPPAAEPAKTKRHARKHAAKHKAQ